MSSRWAPDRGDLVWIDFSPHAGHEQAGRRPALTLSRHDYNRKVGLAIFCPITSRSKGFPFEVPLPEGLEIQGVVMSDQFKSLDWRARRPQRAGRAPNSVLREVLAKSASLLA
ncbi:MAG TPA: endoribonuclease MazF [Planctomycetota bacterium]|jgi:mRNA interferase MazF